MMKKEDIFQTIGGRIALVRKERQMTQLELASRLGVSQAMITAYETGKRLISVPRLLEIAQIFDVSPDEILGIAEKNAGKRGPASKLEKQIEKIKELPAQNQKYVSTFLEQVLTTAKH